MVVWLQSRRGTAAGLTGNSNVSFVGSKYETIPAEFTIAREQVLHADLRNELAVENIAAPENISPFSLALAAGVKHSVPNYDAIDSPTGAGRFILLYDPESAVEWGNKFRIVTYVQAPIELEIGQDPFLAEVAWSWLLDALESLNARYTFISGTATKTVSTGFGTLSSQGSGAQLELRASWTPLGNDFGLHAQAWAQLLCMLAGFPQEEGTASMDAQRATQRTKLKEEF